MRKVHLRSDSLPPVPGFLAPLTEETPVFDHDVTEEKLHEEVSHGVPDDVKHRAKERPSAFAADLKRAADECEDDDELHEKRRGRRGTVPVFSSQPDAGEGDRTTCHTDLHDVTSGPVTLG